MDAVRQWAAAVCFAAVAGGICLLLVPNSSLNKIVRLAISVFFLCALILPVVEMDFQESWESLDIQQDKLDEVSEKITEGSRQSAYEAAEMNINELVNKMLEEMGAAPLYSSISISAGEQGSAVISAELLLPLSCRGREEEIRQKLEENGIAATIQTADREA